MLKVIINGCNGKMGQVLAYQISQNNELEIMAGIDKNPVKANADFPVYNNIFDCNEKADVIIDFSKPEALKVLLDYAVKTNTPLVIATTGLSSQDMENIKTASSKVPIFHSANMSVGINVLARLAQEAAKIMGASADIEIVEKHHSLKVDAPSGTAYLIANKINESLAEPKEYTFGRHSKTEKRSENEIGIHSIRGGTIVGDHTVIFAGSDEIIEISHIAASKNIFALGAIRAAKFIAQKEPGYYNMDNLMKNYM